MPKFFIKSENIIENSVYIHGEDAKHIATVLRHKQGEKIVVCDGLGSDYYCELLEIDATKIVAKILDKMHCETEPRTKITLFQGLPKADKMELIIQKCVELGIDQIVAVSTERSIVKLDKKESKKIERWSKIAVSAAKQSGRGKIPQIAKEVLTFSEAVAKCNKLDFGIIAYEKENERGIKDIVKTFHGNSIGVFIGPEGGFSDKEIDIAKSQNISAITLGKRILRTETAGFIVTALLLHELE